VKKDFHDRVSKPLGQVKQFRSHPVMLKGLTQAAGGRMICGNGNLFWSKCNGQGREKLGKAAEW